MVDKTKLNQMLDALIANKPEEAQIAFHDYLGDKMKAEIHGEQASAETPDLTDDE